MDKSSHGLCSPSSSLSPFHMNARRRKKRRANCIRAHCAKQEECTKKRWIGLQFARAKNKYRFEPVKQLMWIGSDSIEWACDKRSSHASGTLHVEWSNGRHLSKITKCNISLARTHHAAHWQLTMTSTKNKLNHNDRFYAIFPFFRVWRTYTARCRFRYVTLSIRSNTFLLILFPLHMWRALARI